MFQWKLNKSLHKYCANFLTYPFHKIENNNMRFLELTIFYLCEVYLVGQKSSALCARFFDFFLGAQRFTALTQRCEVELRNYNWFPGYEAKGTRSADPRKSLLADLGSQRDLFNSLDYCS